MPEYDLQPSPQKQIRRTEGIALRGEWTPVFTFETPGNLNVAYLDQHGLYVRIFNLVTLQFWVDLSTFTHTTASNGAVLAGLPFSALLQETAAIRAIGSCFWRGVTAAGYSQVTPFIIPGENQIKFALSGSGQTVVFLSASHMPTGGTPALVGTITYVADG